MKRIFKYEIKSHDDPIEMPHSAVILAIQVQDGKPMIWALVDDQAAVIERRVRVFGTGHDAEEADPEEYVGTFQLHAGSFVGHVFIAKEEG